MWHVKDRIRVNLINVLGLELIPIQHLQGFHPSNFFLACKSKISLWAQFKTQRDGNLVNVEWELTVLYEVFCHIVLDMFSQPVHHGRH